MGIKILFPLVERKEKNQNEHQNMLGQKGHKPSL